MRLTYSAEEVRAAYDRHLAMWKAHQREFDASLARVTRRYVAELFREPLPSERCAFCGGRRGTKRACEGCGAS